MIEVQNLSKSVEGHTILSDLTFQVESGENLALLGANGSGKSLLLRILATLTKPTNGTVKIAGQDAFANLRAVRPLIGYVPETFEGYPHLSIVEYLDFFAAAYKLDKSGRATAIDDVLNLMDIAALAHRKIASLSRGEKWRLCLAKTFLHEPEIWLFDEPLSGLDVRGRIELNTLIGELAAMDKTIVTATNRPEDVAPICSQVIILAEGGVVFSDNIKNIQMNLEDMFLQVTTPDTSEEEDDEGNAPVNISEADSGQKMAD
ncbi:MAG: ABC transporter ATP-binding protein [Candidatus Poribacteria bacterium]|nr:ABC transporter ATP-binding protein [Candidatus Poribacteria bacterium]MDE0505218.1 ABC transporter ATP-binding protein [Candidatus Poribacteria bacterium]